MYNLEDYMIKIIDENWQIEALENKPTLVLNNNKKKLILLKLFINNKECHQLS